MANVYHVYLKMSLFISLMCGIHKLFKPFNMTIFMVKVKDMSDEERKLREKVRTLEKTTQEYLDHNLPNHTVSTLASSVTIMGSPVGSKVRDPVPISIFAREDLIQVNYEDYFDHSRKLATRYEEAFPGTEFTVEKRY